MAWNGHKLSQMVARLSCNSVAFSLLLAELQTICREYHEHIARLEADKYDVDWGVKIRDYQVTLFLVQPGLVRS